MVAKRNCQKYTHAHTQLRERERERRKNEWERFGCVAVELTRGSKTPVAGGSPVARCKLQTDAAWRRCGDANASSTDFQKEYIFFLNITM